MQVLKIILLVVLLIIPVFKGSGQENKKYFNQIYHQTRQHNYFKAKELFTNYSSSLSKVHRIYVEAVLNNAFNKLKGSERAIDDFLKFEEAVPDTLLFKINETQYDNAVKQYKYKEAAHTIQKLLDNYNKYLNDEQLADYENSLKIWTALENIPPQEVVIDERTHLKIQKDSAGLNTLETTVNNNALAFVFDTGANLSTTSLSVAKGFRMKIIPGAIEVGAITGNKVVAQLAVCDELKLGTIAFHHVIFLVLPDEALSFPQINYKINGILGFPVIEALKELRITQSGDIIVPLEQSQRVKNSNMALSRLTPLMLVDDKHFSFDTGANKTLLYQRYYKENQDYIDKNYQLRKVNLGGAGGKKELDGYTINYTFNLGGKSVELSNINLLKEKIESNETVYGNMGQDLIQQFDMMIINFNKMFIRFE